MKAYQLPCLRYGKARDGQYDTLTCAGELMPYRNRIREIEFQWKAGEEEAYPPVWYLHVLPGGSYGLLMRFTDAGAEGDIRHRPHTLLKEVALCRKDSHLEIATAVSRGTVPRNECLGTSWRFEVDDTAEVQPSCWRTGVLSAGSPGTYTIKAIKSSPPPATPPPPPPKHRQSSMPGIALAACGATLVVLVLLILSAYFYHEYAYFEARCAEYRAQVVELQTESDSYRRDADKAARDWNGKQAAWSERERELQKQIEDRDSLIAKLQDENAELKRERQSQDGQKQQSTWKEKWERGKKKGQEWIEGKTGEAQ